MQHLPQPLDDPMEDGKMAYATFRLSLGVNILLHGLVRLPHPVRFADSMAPLFQGTPCPAAAAWGFGLVLPFLESAIGAALLLGWRTRWALRAGGLVMVALIAGTALRSDWHTLGIQVVYSLLYYLLHRDLDRNALSLDGLRSRSRA